MSSAAPPTELRPKQNQFLGDLTQVFRRHKIPYGHPADLDHLASDLQTKESFRSDLFSLCTAISHMSEADLSAEALLDLVGHALTSAGRNGGQLEIPEQLRTVFFLEFQAWSTRDVGAIDPNASWHSPRTPFSTAAALSGKSSKVKRSNERSGERPDSSHTLAPDTPIGSLTLGELKNYLEDIEQRVSRLQPFLDAVAKSSGEPTEMRAVEKLTARPKTPPAANTSPASASNIENTISLPTSSLGLNDKGEPLVVYPALDSAQPGEIALETVTVHTDDAGQLLPSESAPNLLAAVQSPVQPHPVYGPAVHNSTNFSVSTAPTEGPKGIDISGPWKAWPASNGTGAQLFPYLSQGSMEEPAATDRSHFALRGKTMVSAVAGLAIVASAATFGYRHFRSGASQSAASDAEFESSPATPAPVRRMDIARTGTSLTSPSAAGRDSAKPVLPAVARPAAKDTAAPTVKSPAVPKAGVASTSRIADALKPLLRAGAAPMPDTGTIPGVRQPTPIIPDSQQAPAVTRATPPPAPEARQVIEPYNQRVVQPSATASDSKPITTAANVPPPVPTATTAPTTPPDSAASLIVSVPSPTIMKYAMSTPPPQYSGFRRSVDVPVVVQVKIGKDGRVMNARSVSGAADLSTAAVSAMQSWRFRPYLVDGKPVQVVTDIKFVFKAPM